MATDGNEQSSDSEGADDSTTEKKAPKPKYRPLDYLKAFDVTDRDVPYQDERRTIGLPASDPGGRYLSAVLYQHLFVSRLRVLLKLNQQTQEGMAASIGIKGSTLSDYMTGARPIPLEAVTAIFDAVGHQCLPEMVLMVNSITAVKSRLRIDGYAPLSDWTRPVDGQHLVTSPASSQPGRIVDDMPRQLSQERLDEAKRLTRGPLQAALFTQHAAIDWTHLIDYETERADPREMSFEFYVYEERDADVGGIAHAGHLTSDFGVTEAWFTMIHTYQPWHGPGWFALEVLEHDDRDRPTRILGARLLPSLYEEDSIRLWQPGKSPARLTWHDDNTVTVTWETEDPLEATRDAATHWDFHPSGFPGFLPQH